jgi:hypothetical protein
MSTQRCGAWCHGRKRRCTRYPTPGRKRCYYHGGASTGPKTPEGLQRALAARWAGRDAYLARLKFFGKKRPSGRRKGSDAWVTKNMWRDKLINVVGMKPKEASALGKELADHLKDREAEKRTIDALMKDTEAARGHLRDQSTAPRQEEHR